MFILRYTYSYGPLIRHWTMRFEARHSYFKRLAGQLGNFINIPYTLSTRHQQLQCYHRLDKSNIGGTDLEMGKVDLISADLVDGLTVHFGTNQEIYKCRLSISEMHDGRGWVGEGEGIPFDEYIKLYTYN